MFGIHFGEGHDSYELAGTVDAGSFDLEYGAHSGLIAVGVAKEVRVLGL